MSGHVRVEMVVAPVERGRERARGRAKWSTAHLALTVVLAMVSAGVIAQIFFAALPFGGASGLLALYGETAAIGVGLAALRQLGHARRR